jgi:aminopeptidase N
LRVPSLAKLIQLEDVPDLEILFEARNRIRRDLAHALQTRLEGLAVSGRSEDAGQRALRNAALDLLASLGPSQSAVVAKAFEEACNMTETMGALEALSLIEGDCFDTALDAFLKRWHDRPLVVDKWFAVQAAASRDDALSRVCTLSGHDLFSFQNPNRIRSLYEAFGARNMRAFHAADGSGYAFIGEGIRKVDPINPSAAARLAKTFETWRRFDSGRQSKSRAVLEMLLSGPISKNVRDVVERTLN